MNLDLAIQNVLKRSEMESAMHGVMSNFGNPYQLTSYTESAKVLQEMGSDLVNQYKLGTRYTCRLSPDSV